MAHVTYRITLSVSGDHAVSVSGDDPVAVNDGLAWARGMYVKLKERSEPTTPTPAAPQAVDHQDISPTPAPPICAIHNVAMIRMHGQKGEFWSCHEKLEDGSWCPYKPPK
jgi:hypothetical protein